MAGHARSALLAQVIVEALLVAGTMALAATGSGRNLQLLLVLGELAVVVLAIFWPFRTGKAERAIVVVFGTLSVLAASSWGWFGEIAPMPDGYTSFLTRTHGLINWAVAAGMLLVALTVVSFVRQMARAERSHLIRALSHGMTGGVAAIAVAGWLFMPDLAAFAMTASPWHVAVIMALLVIGLAALDYASISWMRELDPDPVARAPHVGAALLPVMFSGLVVALLAIAVQVLGW